MSHRTLAVTAVTTFTLALGTGTAIAASDGTNNGKAPDNGNCFGNFVNEGSLGRDASSAGHPEPRDLGQTIGKEERGCR